MIDKKLLEKRFSEHAKTYDKYANVQKKMAEQLIDTLPKNIREKEITILEIGCGTGYLTRLLGDVFPKAKITAVDLAPGMIKAAKEKIKDQRVSFLCGDIEEMDLQGSYDVVISNATFQWLNDLEKVIKRLNAMLTKDGVISFSTFGSLTFQELHHSYNRAKRKLQLPMDRSLGQSFYSFEELYQICKQSLFSLETFPADINGTQSLEFEYFETVRDFFISVKKIGANNSSKDQYCQRPSFFKELIQQYETNYREEQGVRATYHCLFFTWHLP
ncbi:malonyl-ACP O-methyltransferase BioC [Bacillus taeanensis]|uniref:Malonyl-[acyl-carrier protein] O-methyltransferase n=1 Tax=Bacillus taeanensis TaxID=273032 RepID=A0A366XU74_9BACI|nr:malonyl-ACP O-methyltransferase BioC [Bacillus taeanensis]RBW68319.1 malonyl-[acyl-carrier protein] O-methyltransferase BioC [Bacillus taeanensis]